MRRVFLSLMLISAVMPIVCFADTKVKTLPVELAPLKGDILSQTTWDFSQQWITGDRSCTEACLYGDSLFVVIGKITRIKKRPEVF